MARIFSLRRTNTMRRTQSDSLAAEHGHRSRAQRVADRAARASRDAAAIMEAKGPRQGNSPGSGHHSNRCASDPSSNPHKSRHTTEGSPDMLGSGEEGSRLGTPQHSTDPNTDVFQLFDTDLSVAQRSDHWHRASDSLHANDPEAMSHHDSCHDSTLHRDQP